MIHKIVGGKKELLILIVLAVEDCKLVMSGNK